MEDINNDLYFKSKLYKNRKGEEEEEEMDSQNPWHDVGEV